MRKILLLLGIVVLMSCGEIKSPGGTQKIHSTTEYDADTYNYSKHKGKIISRIVYCDGCGGSGDIIIFHFTDNTSLEVYAYKYTMKIYE